MRSVCITIALLCVIWAQSADAVVKRPRPTWLHSPEDLAKIAARLGLSDDASPTDSSSTPSSSTYDYHSSSYSSYTIPTNPITCPCSDESLCAPLTLPDRQELMAYSTGNGSFWPQYDVPQVTTIAMFDGLKNKTNICFAHENDIRLVYGVSFPIHGLSNNTARQLWIADKLIMVNYTYCDGLNVDIEGNITDPNSPYVDELTSFLKDISDAFAAIPGTQITFDAAWSPDCIDGRCYDFVGIAEHVDYMVAMAYDIRSQIYGPCVASANSPISHVMWGIRNFTALGISPSKIALGQPWYGYDYPCVSLDGDVCNIKHVKYFGAPCSDAAGTEWDDSTILALLANPTANTSEPVYDSDLTGVWFNYFASETDIHQFWYDDPMSISTRCNFAVSAGLRGAAVWSSDFLPYGGNQTYVDAMWAALASCKGSSGRVDIIE